MIRRHPPLVAAVLAAFASPATPAFAQSAATMLPEIKVQATAPDADYSAAASTTGAKIPTVIRDIPQSVTVINRAVLDAQGAASLADALRNVPGITLGGAEGGQIGNNINLRGFSARTDIFLDGMRDRGQYYRDVFDLESVEVLKGPSSMLFGRGSTGGVVNQVSKLPTLRERNSVSATADTNSTVRTTADLNHKLSDTSALRLNLMGQKTRSTRDVLENEDFGIAPSLRLGIGTPTEITLSALVQHNRDMPDYGLLAVNGRPLPVRPDNFYQLTDDRTVQDVQSLNARVEHKISPALTLRNQTQFSHTATDARETAANSIGTVTAGAFSALPTARSGNYTDLPLSDLSLRYASHDRVIDDHSLYNQTDLIARFGTGTIHHTLVAGAEIGRDTYDNQSYSRSNLPIVSVLDPATLAAPADSVSKAGNRAQSSADTIALYANDTLELDKHWKLVAGLRRDRFHGETSNSINSDNTAGSTTLPHASQTVGFTSVRSGVLYQPTDTQSYYLSYGTSFNPSLEQMTLRTGLQDLAPEQNRSLEAGGKWDLLDGNLALTGAVFQIEKTNARSKNADGDYELSGDVRVNGLELGASGHLTPRWQLIGGYTYLDARIVKASVADGTEGKVPANTPRHSASLWSTYRLTPAWEAGGGITYLSNRYASDTDVVSTGSYSRLDATVAWHQPRYDVRLNLINLADRRDFISTIGSDGGRSVPTIGRTAQLTVTYRF